MEFTKEQIEELKETSKKLGQKELMIKIEKIIKEKLLFYDDVEPMGVHPNQITREIMGEIKKLSNN